MALDEPTIKMSKSAASSYNYIALTDDADTMRKKIMRAVTDSEAGVVYDPEKKPAVANLLAIYHHLTGESIKILEDRYVGKGYGDFKKDLAEIVVSHFSPISKKMSEFKADPGELQRILNEGRNTAHEIAQEKMKLVRDRMGIGRIGSS